MSIYNRIVRGTDVLTNKFTWAIITGKKIIAHTKKHSSKSLQKYLLHSVNEG